MKVLQLNVWMGKVEEPLRHFLENNQYDIICMQEVVASPDRELQASRMCFDLSRILKASKMPHHFFSPNFGMEFAGGTLEIGNLIMSRVPFKKTNSTFINGSYNPHTLLGESPANNLNLQIAYLENGLTVVNHHGYWQPQPLGNEDTIRAFTKVSEQIKKISTPLIVCGDLNIAHDAPAMRSLDFLHDLTYEYHTKNTLSSLINVAEFQVLPDTISDHLALEATVEILPF